MGGGGALEKLIPGYKDRIWNSVPSAWKQRLICYWNYRAESEIVDRLRMSRRIASYQHNVVDRLTPSYEHRVSKVDYKRQGARGTLVDYGFDYYLPSVSEQNRVYNLNEPYTKEEIEEREKYRYFSLKLLLGACAAFIIVDGYLQAKPVAWCLETAPPEAPHYPWWFKATTHSHDIGSVRRGYEVYRQVCATCHSMKEVHFRHLVGDVYPEKRTKDIAQNYDVIDGPDDQGEMFTRPGQLTDKFPNPYPNNNAARYANGGAIPPDLSCIAASTHAGPNYIMALLLGYRDPPEGVDMRSGLYYNTYFPGGTISMPPPLEPNLVEYEDGTPSTVPQMAKDVTQFLTWAAEPVHDRRKQLGIKAFWATVIGGTFAKMYYRMFWAMKASMRVDFGKIKYM